MAKKQNSVKDKSKPPSKSSTKKKKKDFSKFYKIIGLGLILISIFLFIALLSYIFTGKQDHDVLQGNGFTIIFDADVMVKNWLGRFGAWLAHFFAYNGFGIATLLFVPLFFILGVKLLFARVIYPINKTIKQLIIGLLLFSVLFSYILTGSTVYGGAYGFYINNWLVGFLGSLGTGILLLVGVIAYMMYQLKIDVVELPERLMALLSIKSDEDDLVDDSKNYIKDDFTPEKLETIYVKADEIEPIEGLEENDVAQELEIVPPILSPSLENKDIEEESGTKELSIEKEEETETNDSQGEFVVKVAEDKDEHLSDKAIKKKVDKLVDEVGEYDPRLDLHNYSFPTIDLLENYGADSQVDVSHDELNKNKNKIVGTLENYNIKISKIKATIGPTVTLYEIVPAPGVRISKIKNLEDDIALSLAALGIRIIAPIPGKGTIGIEVPNAKPSVVSMRSLISSEKFQSSTMDLPVALGKTISNETYIFDLAKMPHILMAGATGQGKSVGLNAILVSLLYKKHPAEIKFVLIDPKKVELTLYNKIERHFLAKLPNEENAIITDTTKVIYTLNSLTIEMDDRYDLLKEAYVRNIKEYNKKFISRKLNPENGHRFLPYIVVVIDEFADLIMTAGKEVESPIARIAQLARAVGIHLIIATQRPSVNIITGSIKANFPARIAFRVMAKIDSRTILDAGGADQLIGRGDLLMTTGQELIRLQCGFVDTPEVDEITTFIGSQRAYPEALLLPEYVGEESASLNEIDPDDRDAKFEEAARIIVLHQQGSASLLQRKLKLGYNRAGRIIDQLEAAGIIGPFEGSKARQVLVSDELSLEQLLNNSNS
jgi:S-DNA-T family DNA segregation ATPase FtsK/SpoIIIE